NRPSPPPAQLPPQTSPAVPQSALTLMAAAEKALQKFGLGLRNTPCFRDWPFSRQVKIAVAQMDFRSARQFTEGRTQNITNTIERILERDVSSFQVLPKRQGAPFDELMASMAPPVPPDERPDAVIRIDADPEGWPIVNVSAFAANKKCQHTAEPIP